MCIILWLKQQYKRRKNNNKLQFKNKCDAGMIFPLHN